MISTRGDLLDQKPVARNDPDGEQTPVPVNSNRTGRDEAYLAYGPFVMQILPVVVGAKDGCGE